MRQKVIQSVVVNVAVLLAIAGPVFFVTAWLSGLILGQTTLSRFSRSLETGGFFYVANLFYLCLGGLLQQAVLWLLHTLRGKEVSRVVVFMTSWIIPITTFSLWGGGLRNSISSFALPWFAALLVYSKLAIVPTGPATGD